MDKIMEEKDYKELVVLDISIAPYGWDLAKWMYLMSKEKICIIDSKRNPNGIKPYMLDSRRKLDFKVIEEEDYKKMNELKNKQDDK
jgi:hypothetical protein